MRKKPITLKAFSIATTRFFNIEAVYLEFSNGKKRKYERLKPLRSRGAVLVVPMLDEDTVLMIYEYSCGTDRYELALTKGKIDEGECIFTAANRELVEEIGYGSKKLSLVKTITLAPGYQANINYIILAQDLYVDRADGDEPEPLEVVKHKLSNLEQLAYNEDLTEARSIAALYMVRDVISRQQALLYNEV